MNEDSLEQPHANPSVPNYMASASPDLWCLRRTRKMNFTSKAPDKPGFYVHRYRPDGEIAVYEFTTSDSFRGPTFGEWCLLLPADELCEQCKRIEEAFREGVMDGRSNGGLNKDMDTLWLTSNAKKKLEGLK